MDTTTNNLGTVRFYGTTHHSGGSVSWKYTGWTVFDDDGTNYENGDKNQWNYQSAYRQYEPSVDIETEKNDVGMKVDFLLKTRFSDQKVTGDYAGNFENVVVHQILPPGVLCDSGSEPAWVCNSDTNETNGIYRITFSYQIDSNLLQYQPPAVAFQLFDSPDTIDPSNELGSISRGYSFYYRNSPTSASLQNTFTYVALETTPDAMPPIIYLRAGYYVYNDDRTETFEQSAGAPNIAIDLSKAQTDQTLLAQIQDTLSIGWKFDNDNDFTGNNGSHNGGIAYLYANGMHQGKLEPYICASDYTNCLMHSNGYGTRLK